MSNINVHNPFQFQVGIPLPQQAPQQPTVQQQVQQAGATPLGHPGFRFQRPAPGQVPAGEINPLTGLPFQSYQEWAAVRMPEAMQHAQAAQTPFTQPVNAQVPSQPQTMGDMAAIVRQLLGQK